MTTYISFLQGINVSGQKTIKMDALKQSYLSLGFQNVETYIQSGNVIFSSNEVDVKELAKQISNRIQHDFGFDVPVLVISAESFETIITDNPLLQDKEVTHFHVTFLSDSPVESDFELIKSKVEGNELIQLKNNTLYLYLPNGYGRTKLNNNFIESKLKVSATTRNWKTCLKLLEMVQK